MEGLPLEVGEIEGVDENETEVLPVNINVADGVVGSVGSLGRTMSGDVSRVVSGVAKSGDGNPTCDFSSFDGKGLGVVVGVESSLKIGWGVSVLVGIISVAATGVGSAGLNSGDINPT